MSNEPPSDCQRCGGSGLVNRADDVEYEPCPDCAIEPPFNSDRDALAKLYLACLGCLSPSERRDTGLAPLLDHVGRYLGVPDAE